MSSTHKMENRGPQNRGMAGRSHDDIMASLPKERRERIEARAAEMIRVKMRGHVVIDLLQTCDFPGGFVDAT